RGESLLALGKYDKAIEDFNATLNVDNKNPNGWAGLGVAYEKQGNRVKAAESYQRALVLDPNNRIARDGASRVRV
ncbi:MAG: tetratricopeptide repeat protein, partial [Hyphomicrobiales bacterium]|nr:tetratricopeptide repeat protein [Hyphomicrobiales bacterium]